MPPAKPLKSPSKKVIVPERPPSARVARSNALLAQVKAADEAAKVQAAVDGLVKLLELPPREADVINTSDFDPEKLKWYNHRVGVLKESWVKFSEKRKVQTTSRDAIYELFLIETTALALLMFGPERVALWEARYGGDSRDIFEIADPEDQCLGAIGDIAYGETPCWICGMPIYFTKDDLPDRDANGHSPECEHVLPIAQAALFLQLYDKSNTDATQFALEYDWSHKTCNQTKNNDVYFRTRSGKLLTDSDFVPMVDVDKYTALLEKILTSTRADADRPRPAGVEPHPKRGAALETDKYSFRDTLGDWIHFNYDEGRSIATWKAQRVAVMTEKYEAILRTIDTRNYAMSPELYILSLASAAASIIERQDLNRRPPKGGISRRRETLFGFRPSVTLVQLPPVAAPVAVPEQGASNAAAAAASASGAPPPPPAEALPASSLPPAEPVEPLPVFDEKARLEDAAAEAKVLSKDYEPLPIHVTEMLEPLKMPSLAQLSSPGQLPPSEVGSLDSFLPATYRISVLSRIRPPRGPNGLSGLFNTGLKFQLPPHSVLLSSGPPDPSLVATAAATGFGTVALGEDMHRRTSPRPPAPRDLGPFVPSGDISERRELPPHGTPAKGTPAKGRKGGRRTRRRTQSFLPHRRRRTHHAIKMSSRRHSVSGMVSSRRLTSSKVLSSGSSSGPSGRRVSSTRMSTKPVPHGGF